MQNARTRAITIAAISLGASFFISFITLAILGVLALGSGGADSQGPFIMSIVFYLALFIVLIILAIPVYYFSKTDKPLRDVCMYVLAIFGIPFTLWLYTLVRDFLIKAQLS